MLSSLQIVASAYGNKLGVNVVPSNQASTDGTTIRTVIDEENPEATWGFLKHEAAHIRYTDSNLFDFSRMEELFKQHTKLIENGVTFENFFSIVNGLEDSRIEYKFSREYSGAYKTFDAMNAFLIKKGLWSAGMASNFQNAAIQYLGLYSAGSVDGLNYPSCESLSETCEIALLAFANSDQVNFLKRISLEAVRSKTTLDVVNLAIESLYFLLEQLQASANDSQPQSGQPDDKSNGQPQSGQPDGKSNGQPQSGQPDDKSNGQPQSGQPDDKSNGQPQSGQPDGKSNGQPQSGQPDGKSNGQPQSGQPDGKSNGQPQKVIDFNCDHKVVDKGDLISEALNNSKTKTHIKSDLHKEPTRISSLQQEPVDRFSEGVALSGPLRNKIKHLLKARSRSSVVNAKRGRKLDRRNLAKVKLGKTNLFLKKTEGVSSNSAVYITTDISGSMKGQMGCDTRINSSLKALSALITSIDHYKECDYALTTFSRSTQVIKAFGESGKNVSGVIDRIEAGGATRISNSLVYGAKSFASVSGKYNRNVMIVITDGTPSDYEEAKEIIKDIKASNVDVFAFGVALNSDAEQRMREMFTTNFINLSDPKLLQQEIVKVAEIIM